MSHLIDFDVSNTLVRGASFDKAVAKIKEAFDFAHNLSPKTIRLYPSDYKAILGQLQISLNKSAREKAAAERRASGRKDVVKIEPDKVGRVTFRGIPLELGCRQSRPRAVKPDTSLYSDRPSRFRALALIAEAQDSGKTVQHKCERYDEWQDGPWQLDENDSNYRIKPEPRVVWVNFYGGGLCLAYHYDSEKEAKDASVIDAIGVAVRVELPQ